MAKKILLNILFLFSVICAFSQTINNTATVINLTETEFLLKVANFETDSGKFTYLGDNPCIIDFYADWCGPCRRVAPILEELSKEYAGKIYIYKINVDKEKKIAALFGISSIPAILFIPQKGKPLMATGLYPKATYVQIINSFLLKN